MISALTSVWLPCVVGSVRQKTFLTSALVSLASKVLLLAVVMLLTYLKVIETNDFLLWCYDIPSAEAKVKEHNLRRYQSWALEICQFPKSEDYSSCDGSSTSRLSQKIRVCNSSETENVFRLLVLLVVLASNLQPPQDQ